MIYINKYKSIIESRRPAGYLQICGGRESPRRPWRARWRAGRSRRSDPLPANAVMMPQLEIRSNSSAVSRLQ